MIFTEDMRDLIELFEQNAVQYALVGGFAVNFYGYVRTTQDIDFLLFPSHENAARVIQALREFGFGEAGIPSDMDKLAAAACSIGSDCYGIPPHDWVIEQALERHREEPEWPFYLCEETFAMWKKDIVASYWIVCYLQRYSP